MGRGCAARRAPFSFRGGPAEEAPTTAILVAFAGDDGDTHRMAEAVASGAAHPGSDMVPSPASEAAEARFEAAGGMAIGSPVQMSSLDWEVRRLIDEILGPLWRCSALAGEVGVAFATGGGHGSAGAGCEPMMVPVPGAMAKAGMMLLPQSETAPGRAGGGLQWGPSARSAGPHTERTGIEGAMLVGARSHGPHLERMADALAERGILAT